MDEPLNPSTADQFEASRRATADANAKVGVGPLNPSVNDQVNDTRRARADVDAKTEPDRRATETKRVDDAKRATDTQAKTDFLRPGMVSADPILTPERAAADAQNDAARQAFIDPQPSKVLAPEPAAANAEAKRLADIREVNAAAEPGRFAPSTDFAMQTRPDGAPMSAKDTLRAYEDEVLGVRAGRINGEVERGHGSPWAALSPELRARHAALERLVVCEKAVQDADVALLKAQSEHDAATRMVDAATKAVARPADPVDGRAPAGNLPVYGPTVAEWVTSGHRASDYPPPGYLPRSTKDEIDRAIAEQDKSGPKPFNPTEMRPVDNGFPHG